MIEQSVMEEIVQRIREMAEAENKTVEEVVSDLEKLELKKIKKEQMLAREKRKAARAESNLKKLERTKRTHQLIKMGAALSSVLGRTLSDDEYQKLFDFYSAARADEKNVSEYFANKKEEKSSI